MEGVASGGKVDCGSRFGLLKVTVPDAPTPFLNSIVDIVVLESLTLINLFIQLKKHNEPAFC